MTKKECVLQLRLLGWTNIISENTFEKGEDQIWLYSNNEIGFEGTCVYFYDHGVRHFEEAQNLINAVIEDDTRQSDPTSEST